jgi:DNA ligase (NAD+)
MPRLKDLIIEIDRHKDLYYNGEPEISDGEYDKLEEQFKKELEKTVQEKNEATIDIIKQAEETLENIGKDETDGFPKKKHILHMHSQEKVNTPDDFIKWCEKRQLKEFVVQYKLDGNSLGCIYENGEFIAGISRGDGKIGDNASNNVRKMKGFVKEITGFTGEIRGEVILTKKIFNEKYKEKGMKNPRNTASGIFKQKNGENCFDLEIIYYDAKLLDEENNFKTEKEKIKWMCDNKIPIVETLFFNNPKEIIQYWENLNLTRKELEYDIDGIVIKNNEIDLEDQKRNKPEKQIAMKWNTEKVITTLLDVEWSRHGHNYTPIAILQPVELLGTTVKRASLANLDEIERLGVFIGDEVVITKRGEIIPKIERVAEHDEGDPIGIYPPENCEVCNTKLINEGTRLYCPNTDCDGRAYKRIEKFISKLDVKGFGPALLNHIYDKGFVKKISDFYTVNLDEVLSSTNLKKATKKAFDNLYEIKEVSLSIFISMLDIEGIGEGVVDFIVEAGHDTLDKIKKADLTTINGIGPDRAEKLDLGLHEMEEEIDTILEHIKISEPNKEEKKMEGSLKGQHFCFTGKMETMKRDEAQTCCILYGGIFDKSVTKKTNYLVTNESSESSKSKKAKELGTQVITESEFLKMCSN